MNKVIAVFANGGTMTTTQTALWQYDYGQILVIQGVQLPTAYEVHFCNSKDSTTITSIGDADGVVIPDQFLQNGEVIYAYVYLHTGDSDGETEYKITIPVMDRAEPTDIEPTPAQESTIGQLISALNDAVDTAEEAASKGPIIQNDYWFIWDSTAGEYVTTDVKAEGVDGNDGNIIWWTTAKVLADGDNATTVRRRLNGPDGLIPAVDDYVFGPAIGFEGDPTTLYVITASAITVTLIALGSIVGPAGQDGAPGQNGTDGADGQDGYSPEVTITEITGGHRVTITDEEHPSGQSFDVMDGTGSSITVDSALSDSSENPVQNKVIKAALDNKGTYSKPSGGIPKTDLASDVQTSLGKADTALQPGDVDEPLVATYTIDSLPNGSPVSATCDKTFSELATAMYAGTSIVCLVKYGAFPLAITGNVTNDFGSSINASAVFSRGLFGSIVHDSDDTCTVDIGVFADGSIEPGNESPVSGNDVYNALLGKLDINQGSGNAGKFLVVGSDGNVTTMTLATWQGGSF